jgi:hypothetical protein
LDAVVDANTYVGISNSATSEPDVYRTSNAGLSWQRVTAFPLGGSWYHIDFVTPMGRFHGIVVISLRQLMAV